MELLQQYANEHSGDEEMSSLVVKANHAIENYRYACLTIANTEIGGTNE